MGLLRLAEPQYHFGEVRRRSGDSLLRERSGGDEQDGEEAVRIAGEAAQRSGGDPQAFWHFFTVWCAGSEGSLLCFTHWTTVQTTHLTERSHGRGAVPLTPLLRLHITPSHELRST